MRRALAIVALLLLGCTPAAEAPAPHGNAQLAVSAAPAPTPDGPSTPAPVAAAVKPETATLPAAAEEAAVTQAVAAARAYFAEWQEDDGSRIATGLRLGSVVLAERPVAPAATRLLATESDSLPAAYQGAFLESPLGVWLLGEQAALPLPLRTAPLRLGTALTLVGQTQGRLLAIRTRIASAPVSEASGRCPWPLTWLDHTPLPLPMPLLAFTDDMRVAGLVWPSTEPLLSMLDAQALASLVGARRHDDLATFLAPAFTPTSAAATHPWLGLHVQPFDPALAARFGLAADESGLVVTAVAPGSPAAHAGLWVGDLLRRFGTLDFPTLPGLAEQESALRFGEPVPLTVQRQGERLTLVVTPLARPTP